MIGRPSEYSEEVLNKAIDYCQNYEKLGEVIPSIAGLAICLDITRETVRVWAKDENKKDFSAIVARILASQEKKLVNSGLKDDFNASITKLLLTKHGYTDKVETDVTTAGKPISILNGVLPHNGNQENSPTVQTD